MVPGKGFSLVMTGGMVSFGPPVGGVVVFAHEGEKTIIARMMATGIRGRYVFRILFIFYDIIGLPLRHFLFLESSQVS